MKKALQDFPLLSTPTQITYPPNASCVLPGSLFMHNNDIEKGIPTNHVLSSASSLLNTRSKVSDLNTSPPIVNDLIAESLDWAGQQSTSLKVAPRVYGLISGSQYILDQPPEMNVNSEEFFAVGSSSEECIDSQNIGMHTNTPHLVENNVALRNEEHNTTITFLAIVNKPIHTELSIEINDDYVIEKEEDSDTEKEDSPTDIGGVTLFANPSLKQVNIRCDTICIDEDDVPHADMTNPLKLRRNSSPPSEYITPDIVILPSGRSPVLFAVPIWSLDSTRSVVHNLRDANEMSFEKLYHVEYANDDSDIGTFDNKKVQDSDNAINGREPSPFPDAYYVYDYKEVLEKKSDQKISQYSFSKIRFCIRISPNFYKKLFLYLYIYIYIYIYICVCVCVCVCVCMYIILCICIFILYLSTLYIYILYFQWL